jgi:hypothetical protein
MAVVLVSKSFFKKEPLPNALCINNSFTFSVTSDCNYHKIEFNMHLTNIKAMPNAYSKFTKVNCIIIIRKSLNSNKLQCTTLVVI